MSFPSYQPPRLMPVQKGVTLIVALIFMTVLTLFVSAGARSTLMQERMSGYSWEQSMAFQVAEYALRQGELKVATIPNASSLPDACTDGLCQMGEMPDWSSTTTWSSASSSTYRTVTLPDAWANLSPALADNPKYIVEYMGQSKCRGCEGGRDIYKVVGRGVGRNAGSQSYVSSNYQP